MKVKQSAVAGIASIGWLVSPSIAAEINIKAINEANFGAQIQKRINGIDSVMLKVQVLLDRRWFSPGEIDGRDGENVRKAIAAFQRVENLRADGKLNAEVFTRLNGTSSEPVLIEYTITEEDVKGPFLTKLPFQNGRHAGS